MIFLFFEMQFILSINRYVLPLALSIVSEPNYDEESGISEVLGVTSVSRDLIYTF